MRRKRMPRELIKIDDQSLPFAGVMVAIDKDSPLIGGPQAAVDAEELVTRLTGRATYSYMDGRSGLLIIGTTAEEKEAT